MLPLHPGMSLEDRMVLAVERVRDRLMRATSALEHASVPYAVAGGNAVAAWVATIDTSAVRTTQDVDILLRRSDLDAAARALEGAGFIRRPVAGVELFLDGPDGKPRDAVRIVIANEKVRPQHIWAAPDITDSQQSGGFRTVSLDALVRMELTSFRNEDCMNLRDMLDVGLIDATWPARLPADLASRLQQLIDTPES